MTTVVIVGFVLCLLGFLYLQGQIASLRQELKAAAPPHPDDAEARLREANRLLDLEARAARLEERLEGIGNADQDSVAPYSGPSGFRRM